MGKVMVILSFHLLPCFLTSLLDVYYLHDGKRKAGKHTHSSNCTETCSMTTRKGREHEAAPLASLLVHEEGGGCPSAPSHAGTVSPTTAPVSPPDLAGRPAALSIHLPPPAAANPERPSHPCGGVSS